MLGLWEKDVRHFLMVTDCGISELPSTHEPPRASLIREIHKFLDYHVRLVGFYISKLLGEIRDSY